MKSFKNYITLIIPISILSGTWFDDVPRIIYQPDGLQIECFITGDQYARRLHDSNDFTIDINSDYYTNYIDLVGDSNTLTLDKSGYGASATDGGYFYLDLTGSSNTIDVEQNSTLARDWIKIESNASNSNICIIQSDGGTSTSC